MLESPVFKRGFMSTPKTKVASAIFGFVIVALLAVSVNITACSHSREHATSGQSATTQAPLAHTSQNGEPQTLQADCQPVFEATSKLNHTPHGTFITSPADAGVPAMTVETILVGGALYVQHSGKWMKSRMTMDEFEKQDEANRKSSTNVSCHVLRTADVNGESATVYAMHSENEGVKSDATIWVSKSNGWPLRQDNVIDTGDPHQMARNSSRYEYSNVSIPAGAVPVPPATDPSAPSPHSNNPM